MTPERRSLCSDLAFASFVGAVSYLIGLGVLVKLAKPLYQPYDFGIVGLLSASALVLFFYSLPPEEDASHLQNDPALKTKTPE